MRHRGKEDLRISIFNISIDRRSSEPYYKQLADLIRTKVLNGEWEAGLQLPSEEAYAKRLEVSRGTLKRAISSLVDENVLEQIHGKGTFIKKQKTAHTFGQELISFAESMSRIGGDFTTQVVEKKSQETSIFDHDRFPVKQKGDYLYLKRVRSTDDEPAILIENMIDKALCPGIESVNFEEETLFETIERLSEQSIVRGRREFKAVIASEEVSKHLDIEVGSPVLLLEQTVYLENGYPVEASNVWIKTNNYPVASYLHR